MRIRIAEPGGIIWTVAALVAVVVIQGVAGLWLGSLRYFDLPLVFCVFYGFAWGRPMASIGVGSAIGLMQDSLSGAALGTNGFSKTLIGFLAASAGVRFDVGQIATRAFGLVVFTFEDGLLTVLLAALSGARSNWNYEAAAGWLISAAVNAAIGLALLACYAPSNHAEE
jgi:rod shape-determining protein MreD